MALLKCPDCGKDVSDAAPACPGCGKPIAHEALQTGVRKGVQRAKWRHDLGNGIFIAGIMLGGIGGAFLENWWIGGGVAVAGLVGGLLLQYL